MAKPRKQWHNLTPQSRERATRQAAEQFGLSRKQARERYNRGTYRPFAKDPIARIPVNSPALPISLGPRLKEAAIRNMDMKLGDSWEPEGRYIRATVLDAVYNHASEEALIRMAGASTDELMTWASAQKDNKKTPAWLRNLGWTEIDNNGKPRWHNVFWYH